MTSAMRAMLVLFVVSLSWDVLAQDAAALEAIRSRKASFREIGAAFKAIADELKAGPAADMPTIQDSARHIASSGANIPRWFPPGSGPAPVVEKGLLDTVFGWFSSDEIPLDEEEQTKAKPAVWTQRADFERRHRTFQLEAGKMHAVAKTGDATAIAAQFKLLGATCKGCHDTFRMPID